FIIEKLGDWCPGILPNQEVFFRISLSPAAIAEAIDYLVSNPCEAAALGRNGQRAVNERYNWDLEGRKLARFYSDLLSKRDSI
ncbi:glycosyltransferase, partial [Pseudomonas aeruginosa]